MHVCMYIYIYIYVCMYVCIYRHTYIYLIHICIRNRTCMRMGRLGPCKHTSLFVDYIVYMHIDACRL